MYCVGGGQCANILLVWFYNNYSSYVDYRGVGIPCGLQFTLNTVQLPSDCCSNLIPLPLFCIFSTVNTPPPITANVMQLAAFQNLDVLHSTYLQLSVPDAGIQNVHTCISY